MIHLIQLYDPEHICNKLAALNLLIYSPESKPDE